MNIQETNLCHTIGSTGREAQLAGIYADSVPSNR
jgi:hypothetical protein